MELPKIIDYWLIHFTIICIVESNLNPKAIGKDGLDVGIAQIRPILVDDVNRILGFKKYSYEDRFSVAKSFEMFKIYCQYYNAKTLEERAALWHAGATKWIKNYNKEYVKKYVNKIEKTYNNYNIINNY